MNTLFKPNHTLTKLFRTPADAFFGRTIEDLLTHDFFNSPGANIRDERHSYRLEIAVPGMTRRDISLQVNGQVMQVLAQKQEKKNAWATSEFNSTHYQRSFTLPKDADINHIKAKCRDGLLTIEIAKTAKGPHRIITVRGEEKNGAFPAGITSWWSRFMSNTRRLLTGKRWTVASHKQ